MQVQAGQLYVSACNDLPQGRYFMVLERGCPTEIHVRGFLDRVKTLTVRSADRSLLLLLGSGASRQSGIKTADEIVADWLEILRTRKYVSEGGEDGD